MGGWNGEGRFESVEVWFLDMRKGYLTLSRRIGRMEGG